VKIVIDEVVRHLLA